MTSPPRSATAIPTPPRPRRDPFRNHPTVSSIVATLIATAILFGITTAWQAARRQDLTLDVLKQPACGGPYWIPGGTPNTVPVPDEDDDEREWVERVGAVMVAVNEIEVRVQGTSAAEVVLRELRVVIDSRKPLSFDYRYFFTACGGLYFPNYYQAQLDQARPKVIAKESEDQNGTRYPPQPFPLRVDRSDSETLIITSTATKAEIIEWHLEMPWSSKGENKVQVIDDEGKPFRVAGGGALTEPDDWYPMDGRWRKLE